MKLESRRLFSSASVVAAMTLLSRCLGLVRDAVIAPILGDTRFNDIFLIAFEIPNLARRVLGEGALSAFIVPIYHAQEKEGGREQAFRFLNRAATAMIVLGVVLTLAGMVFAEPLFLLFSGLRYVFVADPDAAANIELGTRLTRIMFPYLLVLALVALSMGACHANRRFLTASLGSSAINVIMIAVALAVASTAKDRFTVYLAFAVVLGVSIRLLLMLPTLWKLGWRFRWDFQLRTPAMRTLFARMGVATIAMGVAQINIMISKSLAFWCGEGAVAYLNYSSRLIQFPLAILASAVATALVPAISESVTHERYTEARDLARSATRALAIVMIPAMVGFWVMGEPVIRLLFQRGAWEADATANTAFALTMSAIGLLPWTLTKLLVPLFYAKGDVKTPVKVAGVTVAINAAANLILMQTALSYAGLALGSSIAAGFNAWALWHYLKRDLGSLWDAQLGEALFKCSVAAAFMGALCWKGRDLWETYLPYGDFAPRLAQVVLLCCSSAGVYFAAAYLLHVPGLRETLALLKRKKKRAKASPDTPAGE